MHRNRKVKANITDHSTEDVMYAMSSKPVKPRAMLLGLFIRGADTEVISWHFRRSEIEHPKARCGREQASSWFPFPNPAAFHGIYQNTSGEGFAAVVQQGGSFLFQRAQNRNSVIFHWRQFTEEGWRGGGALAPAIPSAASSAALSAVIMCHTLH